MRRQIREMFAKSLNMSEVTTTDMTVEKVTTQQTGICLHPAHNHCANVNSTLSSANCHYITGIY